MNARSQFRTRTLVANASRGDAVAVEELLVRYLPGLRAYIRLRAGPAVRAREDVSDVAQSVCPEILRNVDRFHYGGEAGFKHWLFTTALRSIQNKDKQHRAQKRDIDREVRLGSDPTGTEPAPLLAVCRSCSSLSQRAMGQEDLERIEVAFDQFGPQSREVLVMSRLIGLSHAEVAKHLGKSVTATHSVLHRALVRLASILDDGAG